MPGQNPMMAYVVGDLLIMPLVNLLELHHCLYISTKTHGWDSYEEWY